jgi:hypothetical protein
MCIAAILNATKPIFRQGLIARRLLLCKHERRLRLTQLCLVGVDLGLLDSDLRVDVLDARLRLLHRRLRLADGDGVVGRVDRYQQVTLANVFVVSDMELDDAPRDFRRHGHYVGPHGCVARPRRSHIFVPCRGPEYRGKGQRPQCNQEWNHSHATLGGHARVWHRRRGGGITRIGRPGTFGGDFGKSHDEPRRATIRIQVERTMM